MEKVLKANKLILAVLCVAFILEMVNVTSFVAQADQDSVTQENVLETEQASEVIPEAAGETVVIEEEETPLAAGMHCGVHWVILILTFVFAVFQFIFCMNRNKRINELKEKLGEENPAV